MQNKSLAGDYVLRSQHRLAALETLYQKESWADVVREAQEIVELSLKGLLRASNIEVPRVHDVGLILKEYITNLPKTIQPHVERLAEISHDLRRDRELAFYGSEDLTPSEFYQKKHATRAKTDAGWVVGQVASVVRF